MSSAEFQVGTKLDSDAMIDAVYLSNCLQCESKRVLRMGSHHDEITFQCLECGFFNRFEFLNETDDGFPEISRVVERKGFGVAEFRSLNHDVEVWIINKPLTFDDLLGFLRTCKHRAGYYEFTRWDEELNRCEIVLNGDTDPLPF